MKENKFKTTPFNPVLMHDLGRYMSEVGERKGAAPTRNYMQHRNQTGYTRIRQTKSQIIVEFME